MARVRGRGGTRRGRDGAAGWWILLGALVLLITAGGAGIFFTLSSRMAIDEITLCPEEGPSGVMAILLDLTDPLTPAQARRLQAMIQRQVNEAPVHTMVSIGVVSESRENWGAQFAHCKPATGENANILYENPRLIADRFEQNFLRPLEATIAGMLDSKPENRSPIMESLQALLAETPEAARAGRNLEIVVASDLLQHSHALSLYRGEGWDHLIASGGTQRLARNLDGVEITLIRIPRPGAGSTAVSGVDPFWSRYFDRQGAAAPFTIMTLGDL